ncbi:MAG TPA: HAD-IC family P-type ATPase [Thermomicrobiales bacterium]|nr:HAD-IC family P-type ATPase [Thermomicrobiales bacterium]
MLDQSIVTERADAPARKLPVAGSPTRPAMPGLTAAEVADRRARGDVNAVSRSVSRSYLRILFDNTITTINVLLMSIVIFLMVLGLFGDALMTASLVVANMVVGVIQESRAKRKLDRVALLTRPVATVIRDGREQQIGASEIVRDDLLLLRPGDQALVDGKVLDAQGMLVDESLLTGESDLVHKLPSDTMLSGSFCMSGSGSYSADNLGSGSFANQLTEQARSYRNVKTPLQREVGLVIRVMIVVTIMLGVQVADSFRQLYERIPVTESVKAAAVIVALVPQGLVFMMTVTYAMAAVRMSGKGALIQRMNAVESTSQIDVLCLDKTGTLTSNRIQLHALEPLGAGEAELRRALGVFAASTSGGNRTTDALIESIPEQARQAAAAVPFSSERKWSALAFESGDLRGTYILGAPEMVSPGLAPDVEVGSRAGEWIDGGLRVLLFARHPDPRLFRDGDPDPALPSGLTPLGLIAFSDELRDEAASTIERFMASGITLKIISGDNPDTVAALARQAGFAGDIRVVSGQQLDAYDDGLLQHIVEQTTVFGRITPQQKQRIVKALRSNGHYVAMIGDGVNDVLALKQAHLAVAMLSGSQVTRSVADIVLLDNSFAALPAAFREGQRILRGMQDIFRLFLVRTLYVALVIFIVSLAGEVFPVTPKQNGLLAMLTVGIPTIFLAAWAKPGETPRRLVVAAGHFVVPAALSIATLTLTIYFFFLAMGSPVEEARTALTVTMVLCGLLLIPFVEPPTATWAGGDDEVAGDRRPTWMALGMLALFLLALTVKPLRDFYELEALPVSGYLLIIFAVIGWAAMLRFFWRLRVVDHTVAFLAPVLVPAGEFVRRAQKWPRRAL